MSSTVQSPPKTPGLTLKMAVQNGNTELESKPRQNGSQNAGNEPMAKSVSLAIREASDRSPVQSTQPASIKESQGSMVMEDLEQAEMDVNRVSENKSANSQDLESFDWDDFEARYDKAMAKANETEAALLKEFHDAARVNTGSSISKLHC
jgi:hypothetical protein